MDTIARLAPIARTILWLALVGLAVLVAQALLTQLANNPFHK